MTTTKKHLLPLLAATALAGTFALPGIAMADDHGEGTASEATLTELNHSGASGTAWVGVEGNEVTVKITTEGLLMDAPHAQHIHLGEAGKCPDPSMQGSGYEGAIQVSDAMKDYGMIATSLTMSGDTSPDSGLAVDRFPMGDYTYDRTFTVDDATADALRDGKGVIVVHGVDENGSGTYDGDTMSDLDPTLPSEATDPALCGALQPSQMGDMPEGAAATGGGSTSGIEDAGMLAGGGVLVAGAVAGGVVLRRRRHS